MNFKNVKLLEKYTFIHTHHFDYEKQIIIFKLQSIGFNFKVEEAPFALFKDHKILGKIIEIDESDESCNFVKMTIIFSFRDIFIDYFGYGRKIDRTFAIIICTKIDNIYAFSPMFMIDMPLVKQKELKYKKPESKNPDIIVQSICLQDFKKETMIDTEIKLNNKLEDFRRQSIDLGYKTHGYNKMLDVFLNIESSFELQHLRNFSLNNIQLQPHYDTVEKQLLHKIMTDIQIPPKLAISVALTPMIEFIASLVPGEKKGREIIAPIKEICNDHITIQLGKNRKEIKKDSTYHVEFLTNLYGSSMAKQAMERIQENGFEDYLLNLTLKSSTKVFKKFIESDFEWMNSNVGTNTAQKDAIISIVNRTSFPSPFIGKFTIYYHKNLQIILLNYFR